MNEEIRERIERLDVVPGLKDTLHMILNVAEGKNWDGSNNDGEPVITAWAGPIQETTDGRL